MSRTKRFFYYHFPAILFAMVIISLSLVSNLKTPEIRYLAMDKVAHFIEYALFSFLIYRSISNISDKISPWRAFLYSALFLICFALFDEYIVQKISNRDSNIYDLMTDFGSGLLVLFLMRIFTGKSVKKVEA